MITKIVLCASPSRLTAGVWRMGRLTSCQSFQPDDEGQAAFLKLLNSYPHTPVHLIADAVEEDYRIETLPHTFGKSRSALLDRRLNQLYRTTVYRAATPIGREKDKRKDDIFLFFALNNPESISPWIPLIQQIQAPLAGVYLLPAVSQFLLDRLKLKTPHVLLTDRQASGLRQTYFQEGKLRVSRLAPSSSLPETASAELYASETEKTRLYLLSQRLIARDTRLSLLVLSSGAEGAAICQQIGSEQGLECIALDAQGLGKRLGLPQKSLQQFPELLYMQLVAKSGKPVNLAPDAQTKHYLVYQIRSGIILASLGILLAGLLVSAQSFLSTLDFKFQTEEAARQTRVQEHMYEDVAKNFPATPLSGDQLAKAVNMSETIAANSSSPRRMFTVLSNALDVAQDIEIKRVHWLHTADKNLADSGTRAAPGARKAPAMAAAGLYDIAFVDGEIRRFSGDYRAALESVNRLAEILGKDARVESVQVVQQPVNVSSQSNLQGSTLDAQTQQMPAASFKLKVVLKLNEKPK